MTGCSAPPGCWSASRCCCSGERCGSRVLSRWTGWFAGVVGLFLIGQFVVSRDVVTALIYLAPLPAGVAPLMPGTPSRAGTSVSFDQRQH